MYEIYVDGSYNTETKFAGYGFVVVKDNRKLYEESGRTKYIAQSRNIDGELFAAKKAMLWLIKNRIFKATVYCDYIGIKKWWDEDWAANKECAKDYVYFCKRIKELYKIQYIFKHIKGHSGNKWNDYADKLAEEGKK